MKNKLKYQFYNLTFGKLKLKMLSKKQQDVNKNTMEELKIYE